jgi:hypothetical protein
MIKQLRFPETFYSGNALSSFPSNLPTSRPNQVFERFLRKASRDWLKATLIAKEPLIHAGMTSAGQISPLRAPSWDSDDRFSGRARRELFAEVLEKTNILFYFDLSNGKSTGNKSATIQQCNRHDPTFCALLNRTKFCGNPV